MPTLLRRRPAPHFLILFSEVVFLWLCYGVLSAEAENLLWSPPGEGTNLNDWFTAANWTGNPGPSRVPTPADTATVSVSFANADIGGSSSTGSTGFANELIIGSTSSPFSAVVVNGSTASLTLSSTTVPSLDIAANSSLTVQNGATLNAQAIVNNGSIFFTFTGVTTFSAPVSGAGRINLSGAATTLRIGSGSAATNSVNLTGGATLDNFGMLSAPAGSIFPTVSVNSDGRVINEAGATITNTNQGGIAILGFVPAPTLTVTNAGTISGAIGIQLQDGIDGNITNLSTGVITGTSGTAIDATAIGTSPGGLVTFSNAGRINGSVVLASLNPLTDLPLPNAVTLFTGSSIIGSLNLNSPTAAKLTLDGTGAWSLGQAVTGAVTNFLSLTKQGSGTWTINEALTYSGGTTINGGTLVAAVTHALGTGPVTVNDPSLLRIDPGVTVNNFIELTNGGSLDNAGTVQVTAVTPPTFTAAVTTTGGATITNEASATISGLGLIGIQSLNGPATITNAGTVSGTDGIELSSGGTITNNAGGTITGNDGAAIATAAPVPTAAAPAATPGPVTVLNSGTISGATSGIMLTGGGSVTNNASGRISGVTGGGVVFQATTGTVNNAGSISGAPGVSLAAGGTVTNAATGKITGTGATGGGVVIQAATGTVNNAGSITGAPGVNLAAGGTVTNAATGKITGTGGTAVVIGGNQAKFSNAGQITGDVQLNASSNSAQLFTGGKISGNLALAPTGTNQVILDGSGTQLLSQSVTGTISNAGTLTKQGTGEWILDKSLSPPVSALISSGLLQVNKGDTLFSPTVTIGPGGELLGSGTIAGSVTNNGLVTPGDAPGTLTITGNYTQNSSGTLNIQFASGNTGLLAVGRTAFLNGTLRLTLVGGFVPAGGQRFTILTAGTAVSGTFSLVQQPTATTFTVLYDPKDVTVVAGQVPFQNFACNPNSRSVLTALQGVRNTATGDLGVVIGVLNGLPTNELCAAGGEISPLPVPSLPTQVINTLDNANTWLDQRLWLLEQPFDPNHQWNIYVDGGGTFGRIKNIFDLPALDFDTGWTTPGADYRLNPSLAFGVYAGYAHSESRFADGTHVSTDTPSAGTYGLWNPPFMGPFGLDVGFGGGYNDYIMKRPIRFGDPIDRQASSDPRSHYYKYRLGTSYHKKFDKLNVEFLGSYEYANINSDQFFEHGAGSLDARVGSYSVPSLRQYFGIHAVYDIPVTNKVTITPDLRFTWIHEYMYGSRGIPVSLDSGAGPNFVLTTPQGPRDEYISVIGFYAVFGELKGYLYWTSDFGSGVVTSNSIMGGITLNF
jgi:autotransporter-associated beta strand protein